MLINKSYEPQVVEEKIYKNWESSQVFSCGHSKTGRATGSSFSIVIPPPNVTGNLHMGHALNNTLQDIIARFQRMSGKDVLWQPGTDHAGIATQMVVERMLAEQGVTRQDMGRAAFIEKIWEWKKESGGNIVGQLRRLGASCDWSRERFTMDEGLSEAVAKVFVTLYKEGLIYRDKKLVNWDPVLQTAISDLEVEQREINGNLWFIRYPVEGRARQFITVATTRPETMLGDTAVAVHPDDSRFNKLVGQNVVLPIVGRTIPIIADDYSDPEKGSGAVKITPAHDFNDFEVGRRHDLPIVSIFDENARLNNQAPEDFVGLSREEGRAKIITKLESMNLLEKVETNLMTVPYGDRSGVIIEPRLTDQWFVDAAKLSIPAIDAVEMGAIRFYPKNWENTYFEWMRNIRPWCISRQIWWGHQIPAWYGPDGKIFVEMKESDALLAAEEHYGEKVKLLRDADVLDTWFSSALWPFSTLGWPLETPELKHHYPTNVLVTGFDIIFFWVARMIMMGLHFRKGDIPFKEVYIHALVRDEKGQKMSKSKGNVMDPLELIDQYGCDALRFTLAALASPGRDIRLSKGRIEGYRNFVTKLWNAARFTQMNGCESDPNFEPSSCKVTINKWIIGQTAQASFEVAEAIEAYRFDEAAQLGYRFSWNTFCDWYLEFCKPVLMGDNSEEKIEVKNTISWVLDQILKLLHPIMPFVTEELWELLAPDHGRTNLLISEAWPNIDQSFQIREVDNEINWLIRIISEVRTVRSELNVSPSARLPFLLVGASRKTRQRLKTQEDLLKQIARLESVTIVDDVPKGAIQLVVDEATGALPVGNFIDVPKETKRLQKEVQKANIEIDKIAKKLKNENFIIKAPAEVIEEQRERLKNYEQSKIKFSEALKRLTDAG